MREIPAVAFASPALRRGEQVVAANLNWGTVVQGVAPEIQQIRDWEVVEGRFLHDGDIESDAKVAVLGRTVADNLFGNDDPIDAGRARQRRVLSVRQSRARSRRACYALGGARLNRPVSRSRDARTNGVLRGAL